ncbi:hypothetical protein GQ53DRAFT_750690 [Thozetella sp. PMI_491]|nr:hypothetical protein GQ53DRAFT_750690 [Thozetella sp. PMI_491]
MLLKDEILGTESGDTALAEEAGELSPYQIIFSSCQATKSAYAGTAIKPRWGTRGSMLNLGYSTRAWGSYE